MAIERRHSASVVVAAVIDSVLVLVFVLIGRATHAEGLLGALGTGALETWWPFLVGLFIGWLVARAWRSPLSIVWTGLGIWISTVVIGMLLRVATGQGTQLAFVIVATVTLAVFLLGWRSIALLARRIRPRR